MREGERGGELERARAQGSSNQLEEERREGDREIRAPEREKPRVYKRVQERERETERERGRGRGARYGEGERER